MIDAPIERSSPSKCKATAETVSIWSRVNAMHLKGLPTNLLKANATPLRTTRLNSLRVNAAKSVPVLFPVRANPRKLKGGLLAQI